MNKVLCIVCGDYEEYKIEYQEKTVEYKGESSKYKEKIAYCAKCGDRVDVPGLWDENLQAIQDEYCRMTNRCTTKDIDALLEKYKIGKEALATMLGWGAATIKRYYCGMIPSVPYSDEIKKLLAEPEYFRDKLVRSQKSRKTKINVKAYQKALDKVNSIIDERSNIIATMVSHYLMVTTFDGLAVISAV